MTADMLPPCGSVAIKNSSSPLRQAADRRFRTTSTPRKTILTRTVFRKRHLQRWQNTRCFLSPRIVVAVVVSAY